MESFLEEFDFFGGYCMKEFILDESSMPGSSRLLSSISPIFSSMIESSSMVGLNRIHPFRASFPKKREQLDLMGFLTKCLHCYDWEFHFFPYVVTSLLVDCLHVECWILLVDLRELQS